jgi:hypothetical protein
MKSKILLGLALIGASGLAAAPAAAAITEYTSRSAFDAALTGQTQTTLGFDSLVPGFFYGNPGSATVGPDTFTTSNVDVLLFAVGAAPADGTFGSSYLSAETDCACAADLKISTPSVSALGFDFGTRVGFGDDPLQPFSPDPLFATIDGQVFDLGRPTGTAQFVGFIFTGQSASSVTLSGIGGPGFTGTEIDITDVTQVGVPEPAAWALMVLGFGGLGARLRASRRRLSVA